MAKRTVAGVDKREYYYMVAAEIVFTMDMEVKSNNEAGEEVVSIQQELNKVNVNCVVTSKEKGIAVPQLARAQQHAQMQFFQKCPDPKGIKVIDVVLLNMFPLGHFTNAEFNELPKGMTIQERKPEVDPLDIVAATPLNQAPTGEVSEGPLETAPVEEAPVEAPLVAPVETPAEPEPVA